MKFLEISLPTDGVESNVGEVTATTNQPLVSIERSGDRINLNSTLEHSDLLVDKSETTLKRVAEKIIDYDMTPVAQALARHLGIDLTSDGVQARNRRGISIIVHGPPGSGKQRMKYKYESNSMEIFHRKNNDIT
jgi:hypothetical protein